MDHEQSEQPAFKGKTEVLDAQIRGQSFKIVGYVIPLIGIQLF